MATSSSSAAAAAAPLLNHGACEKLIDLVWAWDHMKMFHEPVTDEVVPGYSSVITDPIDLSTMRQKLARSGNATAAGASSSGTTAATSLYTCDTDVVNDLDLMVTNALTFNTPGTVWHSHAKALRKRVDPSALIGGGVGEASAKKDDSGDFLVKSGVVIDEEELTYIESGTRRERSDYAKSMRKEEKKKTENISDVLSGMQEDLDIPIEELRKRFGNAAENLKKAQKRSREEDNGAADGSSSDSSSGSDDGSSGSDDDSEEDEESGSDDDEETSDSSDDEE